MDSLGLDNDSDLVRRRRNRVFDFKCRPADTTGIGWMMATKKRPRDSTYSMGRDPDRGSARAWCSRSRIERSVDQSTVCTHERVVVWSITSIRAERVDDDDGDSMMMIQ